MKRPSRSTTVVTALAATFGAAIASTPGISLEHEPAPSRPNAVAHPNWNPDTRAIGAVALLVDPSHLPPTTFGVLACKGNEAVVGYATLYPGQPDVEGVPGDAVPMPGSPNDTTPVFKDGLQLTVDSTGKYTTITPLYGKPVTVHADGANVAVATVGPDGEPTGNSYDVRSHADPTIGEGGYQATITLSCGSGIPAAPGQPHP